jgi:hypothetical protein
MGSFHLEEESNHILFSGFNFSWLSLFPSSEKQSSITEKYIERMKEKKMCP